MHKRFQKAKKIVKLLIQSGHQAMIVGGAVRDHVMGKDPEDFDIATSARPNQIEALFKKTIKVGKQFGVMIVCLGQDQFEVATFRKDMPYHDGRRPSGVTFTNAREDVMRRDFTINGLFWDPETGAIIDYVGGKDDVARQRVCCIGDPMARFEEDHLRVLRAIRFAANLDFTIEEATWKAVCASAHLLKQISVERIRLEFEKIILRDNSLKGVSYLKEAKLLEMLLPEDWYDSEKSL